MVLSSSCSYALRLCCVLCRLQSVDTVKAIDCGLRNYYRLEGSLHVYMQITALVQCNKYSIQHIN